MNSSRTLFRNATRTSPPTDSERVKTPSAKQCSSADRKTVSFAGQASRCACPIDDECVDWRAVGVDADTERTTAPGPTPALQQPDVRIREHKRALDALATHMTGSAQELVPSSSAEKPNYRHLREFCDFLTVKFCLLARP